MKRSFYFLAIGVFASITLISISCSKDDGLNFEGQKITYRSPHACTGCSDHVIPLVSTRDGIPVNEILSSTYVTTTAQGVCVFSLSTVNHGTRFYYLQSESGIIGDDHEGW